MKLLVIRFSALGDVAMTVPVIDSLARQYPDLQITMLSKGFVAPLFASLPDNVTFKGIDLKQYQGLGGLYRLFKQLKAEGFEAVADINDVLRTNILLFFFKLFGIKTAQIDKGKAEKKTLCQANNKQLRPLKTSFQRYADVFKALGYPCELTFRSIYGKGKGDSSLFAGIADITTKKHWIGIAPFAAHKSKILPIETTSKVIDLLHENANNHIFLFGGGKAEIEQLTKLAEGKERVTVVAGKLKMDGELALMSHLDVMLSMDSANMHLASLTGIPVVSVWGATHPYVGFMSWGQPSSHAIQADLPCRPCSTSGNKPCHRGDYACLQQLQATTIVEKIQNLLPHEP